MENGKIVELFDVSMKVYKILDYLSLNSKNEGLAFILDECRQQLGLALRDFPMGVPHEHP